MSEDKRRQRILGQARECYLCHRIGYRAFVPYGDWAWCCLRDDVCSRRAEAQR